MKLALLASFALLSTGLVALGPPAAAEGAGKCVSYLYVADYHWYYVCVDPKGGTCAVYTREQHGVTVTESCVVDPPASSSTEATCVPTSGGLDYPSWLCVDASDPKCAVYSVTTSDWGVEKRCYGVL